MRSFWERDILALRIQMKKVCHHGLKSSCPLKVWQCCCLYSDPSFWSSCSIVLQDHFAGRNSGRKPSFIFLYLNPHEFAECFVWFGFTWHLCSNLDQLGMFLKAPWMVTITWRSRESQSQFLKCAFALCGLALQEVSDGLQTAYKKEHDLEHFGSILKKYLKEVP